LRNENYLKKKHNKKTKINLKSRFSHVK